MKMINDKLLLKIFSALIAVILWFAVTYTEDPSIDQHIGNLSKVFTGESVLAEKGLIIINKDDLQSLSVTVRGRRSKVISSLENVVASVDVSKISTPGTHEVPVDYHYPQDKVMLTKARHSTITVTAENIVSREIPVRIKSVPGKNPKERIIELDSEVDVITITGAQSFVNKVSSALVEVDESRITANGKTNYSYSLYGKDGNLWEEENITAKSHTSIPVTHTIHQKAELPVKVVLADNIASDFALRIKKQSITKLTAGTMTDDAPDAVYAVIERQHLEVDGAITLDINVPDSLYIQEESPAVTVEFDVQPKGYHDIEVPVLFENVPEGKKVSAAPQKVHIRAKCSKDSATPDNVSAVLDARELEEGVTKTVILKITAEEGIDILGNYSASATLH